MDFDLRLDLASGPFASVRVRFHARSVRRCAPSENGPSSFRNACQNGPPKLFELVQILTKEVSQNDVRTRTSKRTDPDPPINLECRRQHCFHFLAHARKAVKKSPMIPARGPQTKLKVGNLIQASLSKFKQV